MMDIRKLKELVRLMVENDLTELELKDKDEQATVKRHAASGGAVARSHPAVALSEPIVTHAAVAAPAPAPATPKSADSEAGLVAIESPMVGTFYSAAAPEKPPFVTPGASVGADSVVCLIEAMKIFNEIRAERAGTIVKVLVQSGQAVEFGQKLFLIRPQ